MSFTLPKPLIPILTKPLVPGWLAIALLAGQYLMLSSGETPAPKCVLTLERVHHSTYMKEFKNLDVIKLNMTTKCNSPQNYSEISAEIEEVLLSGGSKRVARFSRIVRLPSPKSPNIVEFKDLTVPCSERKSATYSAFANGRVKLESGQFILVTSKSLKPVLTKCKIGGE
jgi:hypothetical protein